MKVTLIANTENPESTIALAAKTCYSSFPIDVIDAEYNVECFLQKLGDMNHYSPFEHAQFTFAIEGISRACSHQLVRHRIASYSQRSQRYVKQTYPDFIFPKTIDKEARTLYEQTLSACMETYHALIGMGVPEEDARYILPNATDTQLVMSMNAREIIHFCRVRMCNRAQDEIQELATKIAGLLMFKFPLLFKGKLLPPCLYNGECPEGDLRCGKQIPEAIKALV